jgi:plasmid stability protein
MKSILIRDLDPHTYSALKHLAKVHKRSLQGELHALLEWAVKLSPSSGNENTISLITVSTPGTSSWSRKETYGDQGR